MCPVQSFLCGKRKIQEIIESPDLPWHSWPWWVYAHFWPQLCVQEVLDDDIVFVILLLYDDTENCKSNHQNMSKVQTFSFNSRGNWKTTKWMVTELFPWLGKTTSQHLKTSSQEHCWGGGHISGLSMSTHKYRRFAVRCKPDREGQSRLWQRAADDGASWPSHTTAGELWTTYILRELDLHPLTVVFLAKRFTAVVLGRTPLYCSCLMSFVHVFFNHLRST